MGESPGEQEIKEGIPFVGPSGRILDGLLRDAGIVREQCYITNVVNWRPEHPFESFYTDDSHRSAYDESVRQLHRTISNVNPNVVVCLGEHALRAVTGNEGISKWRGSVVSGITGHKCIATFHPAAIAREWSFRAATLIDFQRVLVESAFPEIRQQERRLETCRQRDSVLEAIKQCGEAEYVTFDIETEANQITAIALSPSNRPDWAVCIPFWFGGSGSLWSQEDEVAIWEALRTLLTDSRIGKIGHNVSFDIEFIERSLGWRVGPIAFDTMLGMHCLYPELPKALSFAVSIYTDHPYYKADLHSKDAETFFRYNATDACLTAEIALKLMQEIKEDGLWQFYHDYIHGLIDPLLAMQKRGVGYDYLKRNSIKKRMQEEVAVLTKNLIASVGHELNINSPKQMKEWLYGELKYKTKTKKRKSTGEETITADEDALEDLYRETKDERLKTIIKIREKTKIISTYLDMRLDEDKRIRCTYNITGTETGRLSSSATLRGTGGNLQNIPNGGIRSLFVADEGCVFINADLSQAEARVVAYLAGEQRLIRVFEEGGDIHRKNAAVIFKCQESEVTDEQRQLAKRVVHASNYGMGPITFAKQCGIETAQAKKLLNQYFATYPEIANWHLDIASQLRRFRTLTTPFGRKRTFFDRYNEQLVKKGLAFIPQSTVADIINQAMICAHKKGIELLLQVHDSLLVQCAEDNVAQTVQMLKECMDRPIEINGKILRIPVDVKIGKNWEEMTKYASQR